MKQNLVARVFSIVLHPIFMAVYAVSLLFVYGGFYFDWDLYFRLMLPIFILTCILPVNGIFLMKRFRLIKDYDITDRKDRFLPFLFVFLCYLLLLFYFTQPYMPVWFLGILATPLVLLLLAALITCFWKISAHMTAMGALIGCVMSVSYNVRGISPYWLFIVLFILSGCLGVSRLILNRHTPAQVYTGFIFGFIVSYICVFLGA